MSCRKNDKYNWWLRSTNLNNSMHVIAQVCNVLQAIVLTEGAKMIKTPTYHVFDLFKEHQEGECVYCHSDNENMADGKDTPMISSSASVKDGVLTLTVANCSLSDSAQIACSIFDFDAKEISARILTEEVHAHNTFDEPENVVIRDFDSKLEGNEVSMNIPACSVVQVTLR